jgi:hypothetical protein
MCKIISNPTIENNGWTLILAEQLQNANPNSFIIPSLEEREKLSLGDAAKLLFDIETREYDHIIDRGVDRMWVIVKERINGKYQGYLDNNPGQADGLELHEKDLISFGPEHIIDIEKPPHDYLVKKYGNLLFGK